MARKKRKYKNVNLDVTSEKEVKEAPLVGRLNYVSEQPDGSSNMIFSEASEKERIIIVGAEKNWKLVRQNKTLGLRMTRHKETGERKVTLSLTPALLDRLTNRLISEIGLEIENFIEAALTLHKASK